MGVYIADKTYKEILPILAQTGKRIDTRNITEIDIVMCWECRHLNENYDDAGNPYWICVEWDASTDCDGYCHYGERRADG